MRLCGWGRVLGACYEVDEWEAELNDQESFQSQVSDWLSQCFGSEWRVDREERLHRFIEEAIELAQAAGCTGEEFHLLID